MIEFKGTKGKWCIFKDDLTHEIMTEDGNPICLVANINKKANAQLISKAPEMLEMLYKVLDHLTPEFPESSQELLLDEIKQLIKEATTI